MMTLISIVQQVSGRMRKCSGCGTMFEPEPGDTHKTCPRCRERKKKYRKEHREEHKKASRELYWFYRERGICVNCGQTWAEPGKSRCKACEEKHKVSKSIYDPTGDKRRAQRQARIDAGMCIDCGRPVEPGSHRCRRCIDMRMDSTRKYRITKRLARKAEKLRMASRQGG